MVRTAGLAPAAFEFQARLSAADLRPESGHADRSRTCLKSLCRRPPRAARPRRDVWGDRLDLHQLQRLHGPRAIYFAICHRIGTAGAIRTHKFLLLRELPLPGSATAASKNGGAHRNRTDQAICLQGKSGFLARTPKFGTAGWTRTTFSPLKRRDSRPLSYDGMSWCSVLESNQAGPLDARVTVSPGSVPV